MRICHFSDSHLDFAAYRALTPDGLNQRSEDVAAAFRLAVEQIVELRPDLVFHSGDLFDGPRPSNRALALAVEGVLTLDAAGIPLAGVAGNHDVPLQRGLGAPHAVLARLPGVWAFQGRYERLSLCGGRLAVHTVPHCLSHEAFQAECAKLEPDPNVRFNILTTHGSLAFLPEFRFARGNPQYIDEAWFDNPWWDYIALGHFHGATAFRGQTGHVWYSGSLERLSWNEAGHAPGIVEYDLEGRTATFHVLPGLRPMLDLGTLDAAACASAGELTDMICAKLAGAVEAHDLPILRLKVEHVERPTWEHLDWRAVDALRAQALHIEVVPAFFDAPAQEQPEAVEVGSLAAEWARYTETGRLEPELVALGAEYLNRHEA